MSRGHRFVVAASLVVGLPLAVVIGACVAGVSVDVSRWRDAASRQASAALGRPVVLAGALRLTLGRELALRIGDLRVPSPAGFASPNVLTVGEARIGLDPLDLLRGLQRLRRVEAYDVELWLERAADGRGNWMPTAPRDTGAATADIDIAKILLKDVAVHYRDASAPTRRDLDIRSLQGRMAANGALQLSLHGRLNDGPMLQMDLDGGPMGLLQTDADPWPFRLDLRAPGVALRADGVLESGRGEARFGFDLTLGDVARAGRLLGMELPPLGMVAVRGNASAAAGAVALTQLQGRVPGGAFNGQMALSVGMPRPRLQGSLDFGELDLGPWFLALAELRSGPSRREGPGWQSLRLRDLTWLDADVKLSLGQVRGLPFELRDARFAWRNGAGGLSAPFAASVSGARIDGRLDLDTAAPTPALALQAGGEGLSVGAMAQELFQLQGFEGRLGRFDLQFDGRGETLGAWLQDLQGSLAASALDARFGGDDERLPWVLALDQLTLRAARGERLRGRASGRWQGERMDLSMQSGRLGDLLRGPALPVDLELRTKPATLRVAADLAALRGAEERQLSFDFQARRSGDLSRWLAVAPESALPLAARGRLRLARDAWHLDTTALQIGRSDLVVDIVGPHAAGSPTASARVQSQVLDVPELLTLRPAAAPGARARAGAGVAAPAIALPDTDLQLELQNVFLGRAALRDFGMDAHLRQGRLLSSPLRGRIAGTTLAGTLEFDLRSESPQGKLELSSREIELGPLLREIGLAEHILDGRAEALQFSMQGRGRDWQEFVADAELRAQLAGGHLVVRSAPRRPVAEIRLREATLGASPGQALQARLDGTLDRTPMNLQLSTGTLADLLRDPRHLPFALAAQAAGTQLSLDGEVALPLGQEADLRLRIAGERLDSLGELSRVELPSWGPWSIEGPIRMTPAGYEVQDLQLRVGQSRLGGSGQLDLSGARPHLGLQVSAPSIQLDDFPLPARMTDTPERDGQGLRGTASELAGRADRLLSARFLRRVDASIDVQAKEVMAGADRLADGALRLRLREGRLDLDPAVVNLPGGSMHLSIAYDLKESELDFAMAADVERFDYGVIARRLGRADGLRGLFSMHMQLQGRAPSLDKIMNHANGRVDVAVWPTELRAGVFNFWSVNLVLTLLPMIDPRAPSQVNCMVGRFDLKDGIVSDDKIVIDTTSLRIRGAGQANLDTEELSFVFRPRAKGFGLFRLESPLRVTGTLFDQRIGLDRRDAFESTLRLIASPVLWPIEQFTLGRLPRDGADICSDPMRAALQ